MSMSKDITENILLKAGFKKVEDTDSYIVYKNHSIEMMHFLHPYHRFRSWYCEVEGKITAKIDIQTIDHFNILMALLNKKFRLNYE